MSLYCLYQTLEIVDLKTQMHLKIGRKDFQTSIVLKLRLQMLMVERVFISCSCKIFRSISLFLEISFSTYLQKANYFSEFLEEMILVRTFSKTFLPTVKTFTQCNLSDFHKISLTVLKIFYKKQRPNVVRYRNCRLN